MARDLSNPLATSKLDGPKRKRSKRVYDRSEKVAAKGRRAVDEGRDKKATRLLKKAARLENRSINIEDREKKRVDRLNKRGMAILDAQEEGKPFATEKRGHRKLDKARKIQDGKKKKRKVSKGTFDVEVDGKSYGVKGKKVVKTRGGKTITKFKARGGKDTPIKRIKDKVVKKGGKVLKNIKKTKYRP